MLRLWPEFVLLLVAIILAVALHPLVLWFTRRSISRAAAIAIIAGGLLVGIIVFLALITTTLAEQISGLVRDFPEFRARLEQRLPHNFPILRRIVAEIFALPNSSEVAPHLKRPLALGTSALVVAFSMFFTMIVTLYLLLDGKRLYAWLIAYVPRRHRDDVAVTAEQVSVVVQACPRSGSHVGAVCRLHGNSPDLVQRSVESANGEHVVETVLQGERHPWEAPSSATRT